MGNISNRMATAFRRIGQQASTEHRVRLTGFRNIPDPPATVHASSTQTFSAQYTSSALVSRLAGYQSPTSAINQARGIATSPHFYAEDSEQGTTTSEQNAQDIATSATQITEPSEGAKLLIAAIHDRESSNFIINSINKTEEGSKPEFRLALMKQAKAKTELLLAKYDEASRGLDDNSLPAEVLALKELAGVLQDFREQVATGTKLVLAYMLAGKRADPNNMAALAKELVQNIQTKATMQSQLNLLKQFEQCCTAEEIQQLQHEIKNKAVELMKEKLGSFKIDQKTPQQRVVGIRFERSMEVYKRLQFIKQLNSFVVHMMNDKRET